MAEVELIEFLQWPLQRFELLAKSIHGSVIEKNKPISRDNLHKLVMRSPHIKEFEITVTWHSLIKTD
jgi:hypothetical protein